VSSSKQRGEEWIKLDVVASDLLAPD